MNTILKAVLIGGAVAATAFFGSQFTPSGSTGEWYDALDKPPFTPPSAAFPIAWTTLYILMAVAGYRVSHDRRAISFWGVQLALNAAWSPIFFGLRSPGLALIDIVALLAMIALATREAARVDKPAAWMMAPYLGWVTFATLLNAEIVRRN
jgi:tryptophan-rich sensory protein